MQQFQTAGYSPSREVSARVELGEELLTDASKVQTDGEKCGRISQRTLFHALWAGELLELDKARSDIARQGRRNCFIGCDVRNYFHMPNGLFMERFTELFDFANLTYVVNGDPYMNILEPQEGVHNFELRDVLFRNLRKHDITVGGRTIFWFHKWVTPDCLKNKNFDELKSYVERHTRAVMSHYGEGMYFWEIFNEFHDWANEVQLDPDQSVELVKFACEVARDVAPDVHRMSNNCCPYAEYVEMGEWSGQKAKYPQRTPRQFTRDLVDAGVDFTLIGQQMYFPYRDLQDIIILIERFAEFGKPVQLSEVGVSGGPSERSVKLGKTSLPLTEPYPWRRPWDEELQADWLEGIYTLAYSKPFVEAINWFDFVDTHAYIENGGLLRSPEGERKAAYFRLKRLLEAFS